MYIGMIETRFLKILLKSFRGNYSDLFKKTTRYLDKRFWYKCVLIRSSNLYNNWNNSMELLVVTVICINITVNFLLYIDFVIYC